MSNDKDNEKPPGDGALTRTKTEQYITYAKWGLMGVGGLFLTKVLVSVILNPLVVVGGLALAGGAGWWAVNRSKSGDGASDAGSEVGAGLADVAKAGRSSAAAEARRAAELEAEAELSAMERFETVSAEPEIARAAAPVASAPKRDEAAAYAARVKLLEQMKAEMEVD